MLVIIVSDCWRSICIKSDISIILEKELVLSLFLILKSRLWSIFHCWFLNYSLNLCLCYLLSQVLLYLLFLWNFLFLFTFIIPLFNLTLDLSFGYLLSYLESLDRSFFFFLLSYFSPLRSLCIPFDLNLLEVVELPRWCNHGRVISESTLDWFYQIFLHLWLLLSRRT